MNQALTLALLLALLPLAAYSIWVGEGLRARAQQDAAVRLSRNAGAIAAEQRDHVLSTRRTLELLAAAPEVRLATDGCVAILTRAAHSQLRIVNFGRLDRGGEVRCSAFPPHRATEVAIMPWWRAMVAGDSFVIGAPVISRATSMNVIPFAVALRGTDGDFDGAVTAGVQRRWLNDVLARGRLIDAGYVALVGSDGAILAASSSALDDVLPAILADETPRRTIDADGRNWTYSVAPVADTQLRVIYAEPTAQLMHVARQGWRSALLTPLALIAVTLLVLSIATNRLVLRWLRPLRKAAADGASDGAFVRAPKELAELGQDLASMRRDLDAQSAQLRASADDSLKMAREVHHRVRNTLQLLNSLISLQMATAGSVDAKSTLGQLQARTSAVSLVYQLIYGGNAESERGKVSAAHLLQQLCRQLHREFIATGVPPPHCAAPAVMFPIDAAVPLALIVVEGVTNAYRHGLKGRSDGNVAVTLTPMADEWHLAILDNGVGFDMASHQAKLGLQLIGINARQLEGRYTISTNDGGGSRIDIHFPARQVPLPEILPDVTRA